MATLCARYSTAYNTRHGISTSKARGSSVIVRSLEPHARHVPLQGGNAFWLLDPLQDRFFNVHGPSFIIQRPETYAKIFPKLRLRKLHQRHHDIQLVPKQEASTALIRSPLHSDLPTVYDNQPIIDVTQLLEEIEEQQEQQVPAAPTGVMACSTFQGLVQVPGPAEVEGQQEVYVGSSTSPRRTKMVGFTCLRCKARSYKPVNPLAFKEGTLVVQCGKCQCWHKIKDHLHLFHDMCGDVFFRASPITEADLPESLRLPLEPFYWHNDN